MYVHNNQLWTITMAESSSFNSIQWDFRWMEGRKLKDRSWIKNFPDHLLILYVMLSFTHIIQTLFLHTISHNTNIVLTYIFTANWRLDECNVRRLSSAFITLSNHQNHRDCQRCHCVYAVVTSQTLEDTTMWQPSLLPNQSWFPWTINNNRHNEKQTSVFKYGG